MRPVTLLLVAPCAALWFGCAPRPVGWDAERPSDGVVSTRAPIDLVLAYPLDAPAREYAIEDGADAGATLRREFLPRSDGLTELRETLVDTGEIVSIVVLSLDETGGVVIHETARPRRDLVTRFEPPMLFAPVALLPGETVTQTLRVTTHPFRDPSRTRDRGEGVLELARGEDRVAEGSESPYATLTAALRLRLGVASIESVTVTTLDARPAGLRSRAASRSVRVFGLVAESEREIIR